MKRYTTLLFVLLLSFTSLFAQIKVACIGNSITFGHGIENRDADSYPSQMQKILGDELEVKNFGVSGATMLKKGNLPYWEQQAWNDALAMQADVVVIKLGTNDSKPVNWDEYSNEFEANYLEMIDELRKVNPKVLIFICLPVPAYAVRWDIREEVIVNRIIPGIKKVRKSAKTELIDLYKPLSGKEEMFPDKIHPNEEGAGVIASVIAKKILKKHKKIIKLKNS